MTYHPLTKDFFKDIALKKQTLDQGNFFYLIHPTNKIFTYSKVEALKQKVEKKLITLMLIIYMIEHFFLTLLFQCNKNTDSSQVTNFDGNHGNRGSLHSSC